MPDSTKTGKAGTARRTRQRKPARAIRPETSSPKPIFKPGDVWQREDHSRYPRVVHVVTDEVSEKYPGKVKLVLVAGATIGPWHWRDPEDTSKFILIRRP